LFCHVYGRGKGQAQMIPGWPCSVIAALEPGRTSWTAVLDAVRLGPDDGGAAVTATQVRDVITRLIAAGHWREVTPPSWSSSTPDTASRGWPTCSRTCLPRCWGGCAVTG
jgi:DDE superfamily endonuclease